MISALSDIARKQWADVLDDEHLRRMDYFDAVWQSIAARCHAGCQLESRKKELRAIPRA